jgi:hypothetical protein
MPCLPAKFAGLCLVMGVLAAFSLQAAPRGSVEGMAETSAGEKLSGYVYMTGGKRLRVRDKKGELYDIKLTKLKKLRINVIKIRIEKEWYFKEEGNPEKIFSGRTYPRIDFNLTLTFKTGKEVTYRIPRGQPIYVLPKEGKDGKPPKKRRFILQPYVKGEIGQTPKDLIHLKEVVLGPPDKPKKIPDKIEQP